MDQSYEEPTVRPFSRADQSPVAGVVKHCVNDVPVYAMRERYESQRST